MTQLLPSLTSLAPRFDAVICDVWGVIHNGKTPYLPAAAALKNFRATRGPVLLLSNAPRPADDVARHLAGMGVPKDAFDLILTSGDATVSELAKRAKIAALKIFHIGPERDHGLFKHESVSLTRAEEANLCVCSGLFDDENETPDDYRDTLALLKSHDIEMICANPDHKVERGEKLIYCAGAIAHAYEQLGGKVLWLGKPHAHVYERALAMLEERAGRKLVPARVLAIGDALATDITGANRMGLGALLITGGIHAEQFGGHALEPDAATVTRALAEHGLRVDGMMPRLV